MESTDGENVQNDPFLLKKNKRNTIDSSESSDSDNEGINIIIYV
jgi:hypothetical protein